MELTKQAITGRLAQTPNGAAQCGRGKANSKEPWCERADMPGKHDGRFNAGMRMHAEASEGRWIKYLAQRKQAAVLQAPSRSGDADPRSSFARRLPRRAGRWSLSRMQTDGR